MRLAFSAASFGVSTNDEKRFRPSPLGRMMIESAYEALSDGEYVEALENLMTIRSIEEHSDIEAATALAALEVIEALDLDRRARGVKPHLVQFLNARGEKGRPRHEVVAPRLREIFDRKRLIALRNKAREVQSGLLSSEGDGGANAIINQLVERVLGGAAGLKGLPNWQAGAFGWRDVAIELRRLRREVRREMRNADSRFRETATLAMMSHADRLSNELVERGKQTHDTVEAISGDVRMVSVKVAALVEQAKNEASERAEMRHSLQYIVKLVRWIAAVGFAVIVVVVVLLGLLSLRMVWGG